MIQSERERNHACPRVSDHDSLFYSHSLKRGGEEIRLGRRRPHGSARTLAVTKSRPIKSDDPATSGYARNKAAYLHIGRGHAVAVKQYDRGARSPGIDLMQSNAAYPKEVALRGIFSLSVNRVLLVDRRCSAWDAALEDG